MKIKKPFLIAEIGINHNGDVEIAKKLILNAKSAGFDSVKFQKRTIENVYSKELLDQKRDSPWGNTQREQKTTHPTDSLFAARTVTFSLPPFLLAVKFLTKLSWKKKAAALSSIWLVHLNDVSLRKASFKGVFLDPGQIQTLSILYWFNMLIIRSDSVVFDMFWVIVYISLHLISN